MNNLHLIDMSNLLYKGAYNGRYNAQLFEGVPVNSIKYALSYIKNIFLVDSNAKVVACFDSKSEVKKEMYENTFREGEYKENREEREKPKEIRPSEAFLTALLPFTGVQCFRCYGYEADDIIYSLCRAYEKSYDHVYIHTLDKDLTFLVSQNVTIRHPGNNKISGISMQNYTQVATKYYDVNTYNTCLYTLLMFGDAADNIPGVTKRWQPYLYEGLTQEDLARLGDLEFARNHLIEVQQKHPDVGNASILVKVFDLLTPIDIRREEDLDLYETTPDVNSLEQWQACIDDYPEVLEAWENYKETMREE